jgi:exosome complex RNA-binding protein Rrp4
MREWNGRFWVHRDKKRSRAAASRAYSQVVHDSKAQGQRDKESAEIAASIERKHDIAHEMNALFDQQAQRERESWERFMAGRLEAGGGIEPPTSSL